MAAKAQVVGGKPAISLHLSSSGTPINYCALGPGWGGLLTLPTTGCRAPRGRSCPFSDMVLLTEACGLGIFSKGLKTLSLPAPQDGAGEAPALCAKLCACVVCGVSETGELAS